MRGHHGGVQPDAGDAGQLPVRDLHRRQFPGPGRAAACDHAYRRALPTAAITLRRVRSPPAAASFTARHTAGTDATGPNTSP